MNSRHRPARKALIPLLFCVTALGTLAGCASAPPSVLLTLPPALTSAAPATDAAVAVAAADVPVLAVSRLDIPEYLVSRRVRYRTDGSTLVEWPDTYWAERIEVGVAREFAAALRQRLPAWRLCEAPCGEQAPAISLQVALKRMDYLRSERRLRAEVRIAVWTTARLPRLLQSEERRYEIASEGDTAQAQAGAITVLLERIAADAAPAVQTHAAQMPASSAVSNALPN